MVSNNLYRLRLAQLSCFPAREFANAPLQMVLTSLAVIGYIPR